MTKFDFFIFRVNVFAVNQSYNLQSSWFTIHVVVIGVEPAVKYSFV